MLAIAFAALVPQPLSLDSVTIDRARVLEGRLVLAKFTVGKPSMTWTTRAGAKLTITGAADRDGCERTAIVSGHRLNFDVGKKAAVVGRLQVLDHRADFVNGVLVPAWTEIRVEGR